MNALELNENSFIISDKVTLHYYSEMYQITETESLEDVQQRRTWISHVTKRKTNDAVKFASLLESAISVSGLERLFSRKNCFK